MYKRVYLFAFTALSLCVAACSYQNEREKHTRHFLLFFLFIYSNWIFAAVQPVYTYVNLFAFAAFSLCVETCSYQKECEEHTRRFLLAYSFFRFIQTGSSRPFHQCINMLILFVFTASNSSVPVYNHQQESETAYLRFIIILFLFFSLSFYVNWILAAVQSRRCINV